MRDIIDKKFTAVYIIFPPFFFNKIYKTGKQNDQDGEQTTVA